MKIILLSIFLITLISCTSTQDQLIGKWETKRFSIPNKHFNDYAYKRYKKEGMCFSFELQENGEFKTYHCFAEVGKGKWEYHDDFKVLDFYYDDETRKFYQEDTRYAIKRFDGNELVLVIYGGREGRRVYTMEKTSE